MDTALSQNSPHVRNLAAHGISVRDLKPASAYEHRWRIIASKPAGMEVNTFKRHLAYFLEMEYEASEFSWFTSTKLGPMYVTVSFKSFAL